MTRLRRICLPVFIAFVAMCLAACGSPEREPPPRALPALIDAGPVFDVESSSGLEAYMDEARAEAQLALAKLAVSGPGGLVLADGDALAARLGRQLLKRLQRVRDTLAKAPARVSPEQRIAWAEELDDYVERISEALRACRNPVETPKSLANAPQRVFKSPSLEEIFFSAELALEDVRQLRRGAQLDAVTRRKIERMVFERVQEVLEARDALNEEDLSVDDQFDAVRVERLERMIERLRAVLKRAE